MVLRTWIAMLIHSTSFVSTLFIFGSVFLNQYIFLSWLLPCLGGNWCGLNWISCFEMTMIQQQLPPLTLLLCWNIGLCSMTLQLHQQMIKVGLMQMDMLCMMLSIHAGMNEITTFWIFCLHTWFYFFSLYSNVCISRLLHVDLMWLWERSFTLLNLIVLASTWNLIFLALDFRKLSFVFPLFISWVFWLVALVWMSC